LNSLFKPSALRSRDATGLVYWLAVTKTKPLSAGAQAVLRQQTITEESPGPILLDFEVFLNFVEERQARVGGTRGLLHGTVLAPLNARLSRPIDIRLQRPFQKSYPNINGLYLLARATEIVTVEGTGSAQMLAPNSVVLESWRSLNPTERYFTLLETWLFEGDGEIIGERGGPFDSSLARTLHFLQHLPAEGQRIGDRKGDVSQLGYWPGLHNLALLDLFGLLTVADDAAEPGGGWRVREIRWTEFGKALLAMLTSTVLGEYPAWFEMAVALDEDDEDDAPIGVLQPLVREYFPEWQQTLARPEDEFRGGVHVFKVSLGKIWRLIAIAGEETLDSLAYAILQSVRFDNDHLFMFEFKDQRGVSIRANHPYTDDPPLTSDVRIGDVPLKIGQSMKFVFDFGDWWEFGVKLERIDADRASKRPTLLESHGKAPKQYRRWD
jgi:hypothetical protein